MPWKETSVMDERIKFIGRVLGGEKLAVLCREFGISRVTGHKIWSRYQEVGIEGLQSRSRAPHSHPNQTPFAVEQLIVRLKKEKPSWGAPKLRELIVRRYSDLQPPAVSTIHCILDRHGLVRSKRRSKKFTAIAGYLSTPRHPNDLWCTDFKGQFRVGSRAYCFPLTISDFTSRFLISCEALASTSEDPCFPVFEQAFKRYGLPEAIRSDKNAPGTDTSSQDVELQ